LLTPLFLHGINQLIEVLGILFYIQIEPSARGRGPEQIEHLEDLVGKFDGRVAEAVMTFPPLTAGLFRYHDLPYVRLNLNAVHRDDGVL
jgi:hypothetical protein